MYSDKRTTENICKDKMTGIKIDGYEKGPVITNGWDISQ